MNLRTIGWALLAAMAVAAPAHAFNVKNNSNFEICAWSHTGDYMEKVGPGETSKGWYLNKSIDLKIAPFDVSNCDDRGFCVISCNDDVRTNVTVPAHAQLVINRAYFEPGEVGDNDKAGQWMMYMVVEAPARYDYTIVQ